MCVKVKDNVFPLDTRHTTYSYMNIKLQILNFENNMKCLSFKRHSYITLSIYY